MTVPYRLNLEASWTRNLDPARKVASIAATYGRDSGNPAWCAIRLNFWNLGHAKRWLHANKVWAIAGNAIEIAAHDEYMNKRVLTHYRLDLSMKPQLPSDRCSARSLSRYKSIKRAIIRDGYAIDWQTPAYIPRCYKSIEEFEEAIGYGL